MKIKLERESTLKPNSLKENELIKGVIYGITFFVPLLFFAYIYDSYTLPKAIFLQLSCSILFILWLIILSVKGELSLKKSPLNLPVFLFFAAGIISTIFSIDKASSLLGAYKRHEGLITLGCYTLLYFATLNFFDRKSSRSLAGVFLTVASITSLYGILQYFGIDFVQIELGTGADITRSFATFGNPVFLAAFLVMALPLSLALFSESQKKEDKYLYGIATVLIAFGLLFTASRGGWIGGFFGFAFLLIFGFKYIPPENRKLLIRTGAIFAIILLVILMVKLPGKAEPLYARVLSILQASTGTAGTRLLMWEGSLKMIAARPLTGYGLETLKLVMPKYVSTKFYLLEAARLDKTHNELLQIAATMGILGLAAYLFMIFTFFKLVFKTLKKLIPGEALFLTGLAAAILGFIAQLQFSFSQLNSSFIFWILLGLSAAYLSEEKRVIPLSAKTKPLMFVLCFILLVALSFLFYIASIKPLIADIHFQYGSGSQRAGDTLNCVDEFEKAVKYNSNEPLYLFRLAYCYPYMRNVYPSEKDKWLKKSLETFEKTEELDPYNFDIYLKRADILLGFTNDTVGAISDYQKALEINPYLPDAYLGLGVAYGRMGKHDKAISYFKKVFELDKENYDAYYNLAMAYVFKDEKELALEVLREALKLYPNNQELIKFMQKLEKE